MADPQGCAKPRRRARWPYLLAAVALATVAAVYGGAWLHFERVVAPRRLAAAGRVELRRLDTDVSPDSLLPPATGSGNAAGWYLAALDAHEARRRPYVRTRSLDPIVREPPLTPAEAGAVLAGSRVRDCDLYEQAAGKPIYSCRAPDGSPWRFVVAADPFAPRPYAAGFRRLAQAALNLGKVQEARKQFGDAEAIYEAVARMGWHLRQNPGSLLDVTVALEAERRALHYLDALYRLTRSNTRRKRCWRYGDAVARVEAAVRRKYSQLANVEVARRILRRDQERVWRMEALFALATAVHVRPLGWFERRAAEAALESARQDADPAVQSEAALLLRIPQSDYRTDEDRLGIPEEAARGGFRG